MNYEKFGDSYDFVKRGILQLLADCGDWFVHPMFTDSERVVAAYWKDYCHFLGVPAVTTKTLRNTGAQRARIMVGHSCQGHLFFDPDTGLNMDTDKREYPREKYLMGSELVAATKARPEKLTLVYDQSFSHSNKLATAKIEEKLRWLTQEGRDIHGLYYRLPKHDHPNFLLVSKDPSILAYAKGILLDSSKIPEHRLIEV